MIACLLKLKRNEMKRSDRTDAIKHLYSRASFGIDYPNLMAQSRMSIDKVLDKLFQQSTPVVPLTEAKENILRPARRDDPSEEDIRIYTRKRTEQEVAVNIAWVSRLSEDKADLREKLTLFWHGHFACRTNNGYYNQQLNNVHREYALGNFRDMVMEVSKTPAMLSFLNNQQNKKGKPNENFARELMELFMLGRGHYTETDIRESARAFTGWQFRGDTASFFFNERQHDNGNKVFFGKSGNFQGENIIDMILEKRQCAYFIAERMYKFFVNDVPDPLHVKDLGDHFYNENYEIKPLIQRIFSSKWFYNANNVGNKIKSPIEFLVGLNRSFYIRYGRPRLLLQLQRSLGQAVFYPPNVAGWPGGTSWIDSSSLLARLKLPSTLLNGGMIESEGKPDPEDEAYLATARKSQPDVERRVQTYPEWGRFQKALPSEVTLEQLAYILLATNEIPAALENMDTSNPVQMAIQLVSTPEYQLC